LSDENFPRTEEEWFMAGVIFGWGSPVSTAEAPAPLAENFLAAYFRGVQVGGEARVAYDSEPRDKPIEPPSDGPSIGPTPDGTVPLEEAMREQREILESLFHQHMPHTDIPEYGQWYPPFGEMTGPPPPGR
jgi:hypothetical protein